ncbi:MAG: hypothetical protein MZU91_11805 [Desulfosudis oleivorans]|nr:hypothetical protein [Desulfosudis oleivorans]
MADWTIDNMQDKKGYFYYRKYPMITAKTPMLHWAQATFQAFSLLLDKIAQDLSPIPSPIREPERAGRRPHRRAGFPILTYEHNLPSLEGSGVHP